MKKLILVMALMLTVVTTQAKTLIVYYSYTNNVERIVNELRAQIEADVIEVEPAEKGLDYAANNYAIGSAQIAAIRENPDDAASYISNGSFLSPSLWIRSSQTSNAKSMLAKWLQDIDYSDLIVGVGKAIADHDGRYAVYSLSGVRLHADAESTANLPIGLYVINGKKIHIKK